MKTLYADTRKPGSTDGESASARPTITPAPPGPRDRESSGQASVGEQMHELIARLYPICRSITGKGVCATLDIIKEFIPLEIHKIPTGTRVHDWEIPNEWNIEDAYILDSKGKKVVDFRNSNLHVLNYSKPIHRNVSLTELKEHVYTLPDHPDWIPYRTSYYNEEWGFCMSHHHLEQLNDDRYEVHIDSSLNKGHLTYGEYFVPGELSSEVLISTHICHPSLCNDNLSGISVITFLANALRESKPRYSYRFLFIPGTIGAIAWLSVNEWKTQKIKHGLVASLLGSPGEFIYKQSRRGEAEIDQVVAEVLRSKNVDYKVLEFTPYGYDERQFCSPGFNLPMGSLTRALYGQYPEYHTSADNLDLVKPEALAGSLQMYLEVVHTLEANKTYINLNPKCEPQLGRRGLYGFIGGDKQYRDLQFAILWVLNLSDGDHSLLDISRRSGLGFELINEAAAKLTGSGLLEEKKLIPGENQ